MILDDEILIVNGLKSILEWDELGIEIVHTALNGEDGLANYKKEPVDIVITDINMPKKSGLEFVADVKQINSNVKVIVLSGYDDFSYAQKAIDLGVSAYMLKPVDIDKLEEIVKGIIKELDSKKINVEDNMVDVLFDRNDADNNITEELQNYKYYTVSMFRMDKEHIDKISAVHEWLQQQEDAVLYVRNVKNDLVILQAWDEVLPMEDIEAEYKLMQAQIYNTFKFDLLIILGNGTENYEELRDIYIETKSLAQYSLVSKTGTIITHKSAEQYQEIGKEVDLTFLHRNVIEKAYAKCEECIHQIFMDDSEENINPDEYYNIASKIIILLNDVVKDFNLQKELEHMWFYNIMTSISKINDKEELSNYLLARIGEIIAIMQDSVVGYTPVVQQLIVYVKDNYQQDMSLKTLSYKYNVNASYLGQLFLKEVGCSFAQYLNQAKNKEAKQLILNTNMKMGEISKAVGYPDTSYFYRKFKEYYGVSPAALREIKNY